MKKKIKWTILLIVSMSVSYYTGRTIGAAYDNVFDFTDVVSISSALFGLYSFFKVMTS